MLYQKLKSYGESDCYGFHMPGHKRQMGDLGNPYKIDITEIHGFDDLHHPETQGILSHAQERAAQLYGAEETHFLVNGSTAGILSAVSGCTSMNGKLLMARNCHRSVYHAAALRNLEAVYLYPQQVEGLGINGSVLPEDVEKCLSQDVQIQAVFVTSPTYEGVCSDIRRIADICHRYRVPLLVDQAHGAHFPFSGYFPEDAVSAGADVVIHSVHKTLPAMTQTALLHVQGNLADREKLRSFLSVYQTSSPSYVLMASLDSCMELLEQEGRSLFGRFEQRLERFREGCRDLKRLSLAGTGLIRAGQELHPFDKIFDFDRSKLLVSTQGSGFTGEALAKLLRERYHLEMEMTMPGSILGISTVADTEEGFRRFHHALHELEAEICGASVSRDGSQKAEPAGEQILFQAAGQSLAAAESVLCQGTALEREKELVDLERAEGRIAGTYIYLYPPGTPVLIPGERISPKIREQIESWEAENLEVHGMTADRKVAVLKSAIPQKGE